MDESGNASVVDKSEPSLENEDESDQAKASSSLCVSVFIEVCAH